MSRPTFLTVATRVHTLGGKTAPPLPSTSSTFASLLSTLHGSFSSSSSSDSSSDSSSSSSRVVVLRGLLLVDSASLPNARLGVAAHYLDTAAAAAAVNEHHAVHVLEGDGPTVVEPWGSFAPALNAAVVLAAASFASFCAASSSSEEEDGGAVVGRLRSDFDQRLLFLSAEVDISASSVLSLLDLIDGDTLVVGSALPDHSVLSVPPVVSAAVGAVVSDHCALRLPRPLTGSTSPWNTVAAWSVPKLALTGFPLVSEGLHPSVVAAGGGGVEEVACIALLQRLFGKERMKAILRIRYDDEDKAEWHVEQFNGDKSRREWHEKKMKAKVERPEAQCRLLFPDVDNNNEGFGEVLHVYSQRPPTIKKV